MPNEMNGKVNLTATLVAQFESKGEDALKKKLSDVRQAVEATGKVLDKMASGMDFSRYYNTAASSLDGVAEALRRVQDAGENVDTRSMQELIKSVNAFQAMAKVNGEDPSQIFTKFGDELRTAYEDARKYIPQFAQLWSVDEFESAFRVMRESTALFGRDMDAVYSKINEADTSGYRRMCAELRVENEKLKSDVVSLREELESIGAGNGSKLQKQIEDLQQKLSSVTRVAADEFAEFLRGNELDQYDDRFSYLFESIRDGTMTARQAIAQCKNDFASLFEGQDDGLAERLIARFEAAAQSIENLRQQIVQMRKDLAQAGIGTGEGNFEATVEGETQAIQREGEAISELKAHTDGLGETVDLIRRLSEHLANAGNGTGAKAIADYLTQMMAALKDFASVDEDKLTTISSALYSIQNMNGFKANGKALSELTNMMSTLSGIEHSGTSVLDRLSSINFENLQKLKVSKTSLENLKTYLPEIAQVDVSGLQALANIKWDNLNSLKVDKGSVDSLKGLSSTMASNVFKFDDAALSSLSNTIQEAMQKATANIKLTIDNVDLSAAAQKKIADSAAAATAGVKKPTGSVGGGQTDEIREESDALSALIKLYEQYYSYRAKESQAINSSESENADLYKSRAQVIWEVIGAIESENAELAELAGTHERVTEAVRKYQEASNHIQAQATRKEESQSLRDKEQALKSIIDQYTKMYDLQAKSIDASTSGKTDDAEYYHRQAEAVRDLIGSLEALVPDLTDQAKRSEQVAAAIEKYNLAITKSNTANNKAALDEVISEYEKFYDLQSKMAESASKGKLIDANEYARQAESVGDWINRLEALLPELTEQAKRSDEVTAAVERYNVAMENGAHAAASSISGLGIDSTGIKFAYDTDAVNKYLDALSTLHARLDDIKSATESGKSAAILAYEEQRQKVIELRDELNNAAVASKNLEAAQASATKLADKIETYLSKNGRASSETKNRMMDWVNELRSGEAVAKGSISRINKDFDSLTSSIKRAGDGGKTFFQQMKEGWAKFGGWSIVTRSFTKVISTFKQAVTAVKEVDAAMTELRKVTDLSDAGYIKLYEDMEKMSTKVGAKLSDTINSVADFSRLGYDAADALKLSEAALVYFNVGDQLENINEATSSIISSLKAFKLEASDAISVVDMFNEVGKELLPIPVVTRWLAECYIGQSSVGKCA